MQFAFGFATTPRRFLFGSPLFHRALFYMRFPCYFMAEENLHFPSTARTIFPFERPKREREREGELIITTKVHFCLRNFPKAIEWRKGKRVTTISKSDRASTVISYSRFCPFSRTIFMRFHCENSMHYMHAWWRNSFMKNSLIFTTERPTKFSNGVRTNERVIYNAFNRMHLQSGGWLRTVTYEYVQPRYNIAFCTYQHISNFVRKQLSRVVQKIFTVEFRKGR
jgi:hypothetical protein